MIRRISGFTTVCAAFVLLLLAGALAATGGSAAAQPAAGPPPPGAAQQPGQPAASGPTSPRFPAVVISPTPGSNPLRIKRAAAAAYFPNSNVYLLGGRHGTDGEDVALHLIYEYAPGSPHLDAERPPNSTPARRGRSTRPIWPPPC